MRQMGIAMFEAAVTIYFCCSIVGLMKVDAQTDAGSCLGGGNATSLQLKIKRDQMAIQSLKFAQIAEDIEAWTSLAADAKTKFMSDTFDMLLASANSAVAWQGSLNPPRANTAISELRAAHINFGPLNDVIRKRASTAGKPATAKEIGDFLGALQRAKDSPGVARSLFRDRQSKLEALSKVLGWFETDPALALLASDLQFTTASIYNNSTRRVSRDQIDKLTTLTEKDLQSLKLLSQQLTVDIRARNDLLECMARSKTPAKKKDPCAGCTGCSSEHDSPFCMGCCESK